MTFQFLISNFACLYSALWCSCSPRCLCWLLSVLHSFGLKNSAGMPTHCEPYPARPPSPSDFLDFFFFLDLLMKFRLVTILYQMKTLGRLVGNFLTPPPRSFLKCLKHVLTPPSAPEGQKDKPTTIHVNPTLMSWITDDLTDRRQFVISCNVVMLLVTMSKH